MNKQVIIGVVIITSIILLVVGVVFTVLYFPTIKQKAEKLLSGQSLTRDSISTLSNNNPLFVDFNFIPDAEPVLQSHKFALQTDYTVNEIKSLVSNGTFCLIKKAIMVFDYEKVVNQATYPDGIVSEVNFFSVFRGTGEVNNDTATCFSEGRTGFNSVENIFNCRADNNYSDVSNNFNAPFKLTFINSYSGLNSGVAQILIVWNRGEFPINVVAYVNYNGKDIPSSNVYTTSDLETGIPLIDRISVYSSNPIVVDVRTAHQIQDTRIGRLQCRFRN